MTRYQQKSYKIERIPLTLPVSKHHEDVQLNTDLFFVNGYYFLATKSAKLIFVTAHPCKSRSTAQIKILFDMVIYKYDARGFNVTIIHGYNKFSISQLK